MSDITTTNGHEQPTTAATVIRLGAIASMSMFYAFCIAGLVAHAKHANAAADAILLIGFVTLLITIVLVMIDILVGPDTLANHSANVLSCDDKP